MSTAASNSIRTNSTRAVTDSPASARRNVGNGLRHVAEQLEERFAISIPGRTPSECNPFPSARVKTPLGSSEKKMTGAPATTVRSRCLLARSICSCSMRSVTSRELTITLYEFG